MILKVDFEKEAVQGFSILKDKRDNGINILNHMWFIIYPISEEDLIHLRTSKNSIGVQRNN